MTCRSGEADAVEHDEQFLPLAGDLVGLPMSSSIREACGIVHEVRVHPFAEWKWEKATVGKKDFLCSTLKLWFQEGGKTK